MSSIASSIVRERRVVVIAASRHHQLLHVLGEHVHLQVDRRPGAAAPRWCARASRGSARPRSRAVDRATVRRHAVDGDRALLDHVAQQLRRRRSTRTTRAKPSSLDLARSRRRRRRGPARRGRRAGPPARSGSSRLTRSPSASAPSERAAQRLVHDVGGELAVLDRRGRQADAVDRHRVALGELAGAARARRAGARRRRVASHARRRVPRSCTSPVNTRSPLSHARLDQHVVADLLDVERQRAHGLGDALGALALERVRAPRPPTQRSAR